MAKGDLYEDETSIFGTVIDLITKRIFQRLNFPQFWGTKVVLGFPLATKRKSTKKVGSSNFQLDRVQLDRCTISFFEIKFQQLKARAIFRRVCEFRLCSLFIYLFIYSFFHG